MKLTNELDAVVSDFGFARALEVNDVGKTTSDIGPIKWMVTFNVIMYSNCFSLQNR